VPQQKSGPAPPNTAMGTKLSNLPRRIQLTWEYHGPRAVMMRALTFPLRFTPLAPRAAAWTTALSRGRPLRTEISTAKRWYRSYGRPVTVVIPSYEDIEHVRAVVAAVRKTTRPARVKIVVSDDASDPEHVSALRRLAGVTVTTAEQNRGFAANVNRGLSAADPGRDVVLLNSDVIPTRGWLACLQYTANGEGIGIVGAKLLYPDNRIQYGGTVRNADAPEWFDHRYRFKPNDWGPANVIGPTLAATGACMYVTREAREAIGLFDENFPMAFEDVDYCLRAWQAGFKVMYAPTATLTHLESVTRGTQQNERELNSQRYFWKKWSGFIDRRNTRTVEGKLRAIYVTEDTGVGGGHRDIFEHLNGLAERGHEVELWTLGSAPSWFDLKVPVRSFADYDALTTALAPVEAIKVATWWATAESVWIASRLTGVPVFFVQDIETSYYRDEEFMQSRVLDSYRPEFAYMTISSWNRDQLRELGQDAALIPPGIDLDTFCPIPEVPRRTDMILALGRSNPLKNLGLTLAAWRALPEPRPQLTLFGIEPEVAEADPGIEYINAPTDSEVNELFNQATVFVQTSSHEGFCLPPLESMATGGAVVCTDAHGNRDFCVDGENCLIPEPTTGAVTAAIQRLLEDPDRRASFGAEGIKTAADYAWVKRIDALEQFLDGVAARAEAGPMTTSGHAG
jgi:GT2 family glycosyltransferase